MNRAVQDPLARLERLASEVDRRFDEIRNRRPSAYSCGEGCSACCRARLAVTRVEEAFLRRGLTTLSGPSRARIARRVTEAGRQMCPALDERGSCSIYAYRPLICRSYGVALLRRSEVPLVRPHVTDVCSLNLVGIRPASLSPAEVLDGTTLDARLAEIDDEFCRRGGLQRGERVALASILVSS